MQYIKIQNQSDVSYHWIWWIVPIKKSSGISKRSNNLKNKIIVWFTILITKLTLPLFIIFAFIIIISNYHLKIIIIIITISYNLIGPFWTLFFLIALENYLNTCCRLPFIGTVEWTNHNPGFRIFDQSTTSSDNRQK